MTRYRLSDFLTVDTDNAVGTWPDGPDTLYRTLEGVYYLVRQRPDDWPKVRVLRPAAASKWLTVRGHTLPEELRIP